MRYDFPNAPGVRDETRAMRALVADSDPGRLRQLETWLGKWGYEVASARDGLEAWTRLDAERAPVLAILAWRMEGIPGIDVWPRVVGRRARPA